MASGITKTIVVDEIFSSNVSFCLMAGSWRGSFNYTKGEGGEIVVEME